MPLEGPAKIVDELTSMGFNAEREAVTKIASADRPAAVLEQVIETMPDDALVVRTGHVESVLSSEEPLTEPTSSEGKRGSTDAGPSDANPPDTGPSDADPSDTDPSDVGPSADHSDGGRGSDDEHPSVSTGTTPPMGGDTGDTSPVETKGSGAGRSSDPALRSLEITGDMTGESTGTGEYEDFVAVFRDRLERLGSKLKGRVNHRPATAIQSMPGGSEVGMVGLVNDIRSTASGHWLIELEDATGTFPWLVMKDREYADLVQELLCDEALAMEGTLSDDAGIAFVDSMYFPDVPRTHEPSTADRHVQAALISDVHVGSEEFMADAWSAFTDWLHTQEAQHVEYLLIAGDMVEGVGVYPNQDEELDVVDIYEQYEAFSERLKSVPGNIEVVMIPGNHDAVRLAEPQPGFDEDLREIMSAHDSRIVSNPSTVTLEGVSVLMYHGVSLDEVIAELPEEKASYDEPHKAMYQLLKKRHVAPQFGGHTRLAPEEKDHLVIEEVPDIFHTGHVHKLGFGKYHNVLAINSGCWQAQTDFQASVNIDPDAGYAPIVDLDTLDVTVQKFS
ncbi:DNA-directed DNA polymerase II small subunit [Natrarchaeobius chitinivorans]|uniref:DNA polymerase II small subunit n=1 Tax=Natrarchaeobius chitinivorans TaxID=1679083 RepID=A0A3N6N863_NATCH|nr:DNA-directed DNA polymerase II small subunit [Natrarchaeobius chitinivorans]RQG94622.1 DNA-directed DNA polymerase II small subunit [Natrarchaeobius chitinivorans]